MVLKRKRSDEFGQVCLASPRFGGDFNFNVTMSIGAPAPSFFSTQSSTPSHLPSRTMKRFRDNRPPEQEVYKHTLDLLYSAQRRSQTHHQPPPSADLRPIAPEPSFVQPQEPSAQRKPQQRSLHSFWDIRVSPSPSTSSATSPASSATSLAFSVPDLRNVPENCEDCGAALGDGDGVDATMMDVDSYGRGLADRICVACRKAVCGSCSISNLGEDRRCLACTGMRRGVGGFGL
ncbi:hypothetical protein VTJ83DRAFT_3029 [Remersonia thermophila]|uniref:Uncharacterized protein n=1 Tax=Remersonia thermophila TaxID=72144 RepID=A0ABR4DCW0_9PEZI